MSDPDSSYKKLISEMVDALRAGRHLSRAAATAPRWLANAYMLAHRAIASDAASGGGGARTSPVDFAVALASALDANDASPEERHDIGAALTEYYSERRAAELLGQATGIDASDAYFGIVDALSQLDAGRSRTSRGHACEAFLVAFMEARRAGAADRIDRSDQTEDDGGS